MRVVRAEDIEIGEDRLILSGRVLQNNAIVSASMDRRASLELLGFLLAIAVCMALAYATERPIPRAGLVALGALFAVGAYRELCRPYVLILEIYQLGLFEARGFTKEEAEIAFSGLDDLRRNGRGVPGRMAENGMG